MTKDINELISEDNARRRENLTVEEFKIEDMDRDDVVYRSQGGIIHHKECKKAVESQISQ